MRFLVTRTSQVFGERPCKEAVRVKYTYVDERIADDPEKIPTFAGTPQAWYEEGANHRVNEAGHIERDMQEMGWAVDISDLERLVAFHKDYGAVILREHWKQARFPVLEIYDERRE